MGIHHRLMTWYFILNLSLLLIIAIEASPIIDESDLTLNERVSKIEAKDRHQDGEITLLKNALDEERKLVHDLTNRVAILEDSNKISTRSKRPVRLLPPHVLRGPDRNKTDADDESNFRFYGPATGCNDLGRLGYTLNGFYLVQEKENHSTNSINSNYKQIEIVECNFKHNPKLGKETPGDKEKRLGVIRTSNDNNILPSVPKEVDDKERGSRLTRTCDNDSNITQFRLSEKENFNSKKANDIENGFKSTQTNENINGNITQSRLNEKESVYSKKAADGEKESKPTRTKNEKSTTQPPVAVKNDCLYRLNPVSRHGMCLVVKERKSKKNDTIITTNVPNYYLARSTCDNVAEEKHWTIKDKHICSNKEDMCLTVSPNLKDGGVLVNLMAYEPSAKSQQWSTKATNSRKAVRVINIGTSLCLYEPDDYSATICLPQLCTVLKICLQNTYLISIQ